MSIFGKVLGFAVAVGAGYATVKVAQKYDENKKKDILEGDIDEITKPNTAENVKRAVSDVYCETAEKIKTKVKTVAENVGIDTNEVGSAFSKAGDAAFEVGKAVANASVKVAEKVVKETPTVIQGAKGVVGSAASQVKNVVNTATEKLAPKKTENTDAEVYADEFEEVEEQPQDEVVVEANAETDENDIIE